MRCLIDCHVHVYPLQRAADAIDTLIANLAGDGDTLAAGCLVERHDCRLFDEILSGERDDVRDRFEAAQVGSTEVRLDRRDGRGRVHLVAGQQIVTKENIEVLGLNMIARVAERRDAETTVESVLAAGGVPVVAWAPGKWFFDRGRVVRELLDRFGAADVALGDTSLRPLGWATPAIIRDARRRGFRILAGSDPLPFPGEEIRPGSYYTEVDGVDDAADAASVVARLLHDPDLVVHCRGARKNPLAVAARLYTHSRARAA